MSMRKIKNGIVHCCEKERGVERERGRVSAFCHVINISEKIFICERDV